MISAVIYYPFFKAADNYEYKKELAREEAKKKEQEAKLQTA